MGGNCGGSSTSLAPGFRFHPTDEELVFYYLRRKVCGKPFRFDAISDIDVYKCEPWDLPGLSKLKSRDLEWYFFSNLDKKYVNGSRTNRATTEGYWKTTGKDRPVQHRSRVVGMKKTLVYHRGRAPRGERSNWVMHEYKLVDDELKKTDLPQEAFVLLRIFLKSGSGPKNGEQYGAPFVEEEWEEDDHEVSIFSGKPSSNDFMTNGSVTEESCLNQEHSVDNPLEHSNPLLNYYQGDNCNFTETLAENKLNSSTVVNEEQIGQVTNDDQKWFHLPFQFEPEAFNNVYAAQPTNSLCQAPFYYSPEEQGLDNVNSSLSVEGGFLEENDLKEPIKENSSLQVSNYVDAYSDIGQCPFDLSDMLDHEGILSDPAFSTDQNVDQGNMHPYKSTQQLPETYSLESASSSEQVMEAQKIKPDNDIGQYLSFDPSSLLDDFENDIVLYDQTFSLDQNLGQANNQHVVHDQQLPEAYRVSSASSSEQVTEAQNYESENSNNSFIQRASQMLGNFQARPAFASEFPTKDMSAKLLAAMKSFEPADITPASRDNGGLCWSLDKCGIVNVVLSFNVPEGSANPVGIEALTGIMSRKINSAVSRRWPYFLFFSALALCISAKVGTYI